MERYVALDISLKEISVCVIDGKGAVTFEGEVAAEPAALISLARSKTPQLARVGLETDATSSWLYHALQAAALRMMLVDARHAHVGPSMRPPKSDCGDTRGLAEMLRIGWYRAVTARSLTAHVRLGVQSCSVMVRSP